MTEIQQPQVTQPQVAVSAPVETSVTPSVSSETTPSASTPETATAPLAPTAAAVADTTSPSENVLGSDAPASVTDDVKTEVKTDGTKPDVKADTKVETKPEGGKPETTDTPAEVKVELPVYEPFKLPEGINLDKEPLETFTKVLGEIETGKLDHAGMQEAGQKLVDLATKATQDSIDRLNDYYVQLHESNKKARLDALKADPELGGERFKDTVATLQNAISEYGGSDDQIKAFRQEVVDAGLDASPALCRLLYNMQQKINKYTTEGENGNGGSNRIVPAARPAPSKVKDYQRFYNGGN